ncbi:MAG TPA: GAF domain-containing SpoIIE family protein phosphatase [Candidatus Dormibacteraeota bacterium]|nr:GAF domain-containing SpoIIE family protein phosphatase [Candidatus Dormibacteraeota bacterium]
MDDLAKLGSFLLGDAESVPESLLASFPEQAKTLTLLHDVSRELTAILDREELLRRIAERVKKLVNYHLFTVMLWNEQTQLLEGIFAMHYEDSIPTRFRVPLHKGITGAAAGERRAVRIGDVQLDPRYIGNCGGIEDLVPVRSELVVPLLLRDRLVGVLDLESIEPHAFTAEHERMLTTLGSYIAIALENSRLYQQARENEQRLLSDLETAREIQRQLLPTGAREIPGIDLAPGYAPARELGGDFYDFLPYGEGRLGFALGDVSGKGTAAALYGSLAIGALREHSAEHRCPPSELLEMLNRRLYAPRLDTRFIAMVFGVYDARTRTLQLANAGSPYPLLVRDGVIQEIRIAGVPLGLFQETTYEEVTLELRPGDLLLFASDGILESEDAAQEAFGSARLNALLSTFSPEDSAESVAASILAATDSYSSAASTPHDDRTLLVLRVTDESAADYSKMPIIY